MTTKYQKFAAVLFTAFMVASVMSVGVSATNTAGVDGTQARTIDSCTTITEPGRYVLTWDVENANGTCIRIQASDVVLDGDGHTITGTTNESRREEFREASLAPSVIFTDNETAQNESLVAEVLANYPLPTNPQWANIGIAANASGGLTNVTVREFAFGVYYDGVSDGRIENVTGTDNQCFLVMNS